MRKVFVVAASLLAVPLLAGCDGLASGETFEDCYRSRAGTVDDQFVAADIRKACVQEFQREMPSKAVAKLKGRATGGPSGLSGDVANTNLDWTVTELEIFVADESYLTQVYIRPQREGRFSEVIKESDRSSEDFSWGISRAWGVPTSRRRSTTTEDEAQASNGAGGARSEASASSHLEMSH